MIKKSSALGQSWTKWPFHDLLHHRLVQFLLVIHYSEAVYRFVYDKGNFHQSVLEPGIRGSLSEETEILIWIFTFLALTHGTWSITEKLTLSLTVMLCQTDITWETFRVCFANKRRTTALQSLIIKHDFAIGYKICFCSYVHLHIFLHSSRCCWIYTAGNLGKWSSVSSLTVRTTMCDNFYSGGLLGENKSEIREGLLVTEAELKQFLSLSSVL